MSWHDGGRPRQWDRIRRKVLDRDGWRCQKCGGPGKLHVHHKRELRRGGSNDLSNLKTLCRDCHIRAHRRPACPASARWRKLVDELMVSGG